MQTHVDRYYHKFRYPASSMIIGLSRANFGIAPEIIEEEFTGSDTIDKPVLNFSFELYRSSYGPIYKEDIEAKIKEGTKNGLFILSVSPGSFLIPSSASDNNLEELDEDTILGKMKWLNTDPNFEYMAKCYANPLYKGILFPDSDIVVKTRKTGWTEFTRGDITYQVTDSMATKWERETLVSYKKILAGQKISKTRLRAFKETIDMLKNYGKVVLVRMPVAKSVRDFENEFWPEMNSLINEISREYSVTFLNYTNDYNRYKYYDGSHFFSESAKTFTHQLANDIKKLKN
ncbi:hypothetical protein ABN763_09475 [Spongiivirga sp. MCCC 1A20706]|uniref:hypothetical protein n=1 Tax=Spongiivirga sp. MCCC 1A20706 TaxID=3160963 RepID=UPI0039779ED8